MLAAFLCLAIAHRAHVTGSRVSNANAGVLGFDEVEHGLSGRRGAERWANEWRDRRSALIKMESSYFRERQGEKGGYYYYR